MTGSSDATVTTFTLPHFKYFPCHNPKWADGETFVLWNSSLTLNSTVPSLREPRLNVGPEHSSKGPGMFRRLQTWALNSACYLSKKIQLLFDIDTNSVTVWSSFMSCIINSTVAQDLSEVVVPDGYTVILPKAECEFPGCYLNCVVRGGSSWSLDTLSFRKWN